MSQMTYAEASAAALAEEMRRDPTVWCLGEDLGRGGVFQAVGAHQVNVVADAADFADEAHVLRHHLAVEHGAPRLNRLHVPNVQPSRLKGENQPGRDDGLADAGIGASYEDACAHAPKRTY
jgi:hypothetical protein